MVSEENIDLGGLYSQELLERLNVCTSVRGMVSLGGIPAMSCNSFHVRLLFSQIRSFPVYPCG